MKIGQTVHVGAPDAGDPRAARPAAGARGGQRGAHARAELGGVELSAGQLAERFGFANERQWTPVGDLSGGERRRLQLLRLLLAQPNLLLLDEPTNDLDTDTLAALEDLLDGWAGHARGRQPRPLPARAGLRHDGRAARRRVAGRAARRRRGVPRAGGGAAAERRRADERRETPRRHPRRAQGAAPGSSAASRPCSEREATLHDQLAEHATDYAQGRRARRRAARPSSPSASRPRRPGSSSPRRRC